MENTVFEDVSGVHMYLLDHINMLDRTDLLLEREVLIPCFGRRYDNRSGSGSCRGKDPRTKNKSNPKTKSNHDNT